MANPNPPSPQTRPAQAATAQRPEFHKLPALPFSESALEPHISAETLRYHHGKHHKAYIDKTNELLLGSGLEHLPLEELVRKSNGKLFDNAAQAWNHDFFWHCLTPSSKAPTSGELFEAIRGSFGSLEEFQDRFSKEAVEIFGSGWAWLVKSGDGRLAIEKHGNAGNPLVVGSIPLLTLDVWEHAYYIDYRNDRKDFVAAFWNLVNWSFVAERFATTLH